MPVTLPINTQLVNNATDPYPHVNPADKKKIGELARDFESVFLDLVLKSMRTTVPKSEFMDGGVGEEVFRSMLDGEYAKILAQQNMTGIGATIEKDLLKLAEVQTQAIPKNQALKTYAAQNLHPNEIQEKMNGVTTLEPHPVK